MIWIAFALSLADQARAVDPCELLAGADIEAALGAPLKERKPGTYDAGGLLISQCFYGTPSTKSVSVALTRGSAGGRSTLTPREYWRRQFHGSEHGPRPISGIGDEAYWTGNRFTGALYVLRGDAFVRISVGGIRDENARIETSRALARAALKRLEGGTGKSQS